jgi:hypothetical protein
MTTDSSVCKGAYGNQLSRLIEKLYIKNRPDKATRLRDCRDTLTNEKEERGLRKVYTYYMMYLGPM